MIMNIWYTRCRERKGHIDCSDLSVAKARAYNPVRSVMENDANLYDELQCCLERT